MFRYVALVWNDADEAARDAAQQLALRLPPTPAEWACALARPGLQVYYTGPRVGSSEAYQLHEGSGVVLGKLFKRTSDDESVAASLTPDAAESAAILKSGGRHLIQRYWGRYVAFLQDAESSTTWIVRDPSAGMPCLSTMCRGVEVFFSFMQDAVDLGLGPFSVNWKYVAATLCYTRLQLRTTGLNEISQVLGGECVRWHRGQRTQTFYWNALEVANTDPIEDPFEAARVLRARARDCMHAWGSCYSGILHTLSGGLDSSIVLGCLHDAPNRPRITALNYFSEGSDTDERLFARLSAIQAGCDLIERERNPDVDLETMLGAARTAIPENYLYHVENSRLEAELARERQATAIFSGGGGDQLFYQARGSFSAGDFLQRRGPRPALFSVALDAARMDRLSIWQVLREAFAQAWFGRRWDVTSEAGEFKALMRKEIIAQVRGDPAFLHPWFQAPGRTPNGKVWHAYMLLRPHEFYDPMGRPDDPERVAPLSSQPLVEVALRTPTYVLVRGGWDRALARYAFRNDVPRAILMRQTKGGVEEHARAILLRNATFVRGLLLEGLLVREGLVDRAKLEGVLARNPGRTGSRNLELYDYISMEAWLRSWQEQRQLAAA